MFYINDSGFALIPTPLDPKRCNFYVVENTLSIKVESIAEYLARVTIDYRVAGDLVVVLKPKSGYTPESPYLLTSFSGVLANYWIKYYSFVGGLADENFVEIKMSVKAQKSITGDGTEEHPLEFVGDQATPGASKYYGTNGAGAKGYHALPAGGGEDGEDGREVELQVNGAWVQWRYVGEATWINLFEVPSDGEDGDDGANAYLYVAYASDAAGAGWSLTPTDSLKYRAEIQSTTPLTPTAADFSAATWVKYIGDDGEDGTGGGGGDTAPELHLDFGEAGDEFIYNVPYNLKFTSIVSENGDPSLSTALNTNLARYDKLTITATASGLVSLYGEYVS